MKKKLHILVLIGFLSGIIAPVCGFMWGGNYSVVQICTAQGLENRLVIDNEQNSPYQMQDQCEFCFSSAHITAFIPDRTLLIDTKYDALKSQFYHYENTVLSRLNTNITSRGPPSYI